MSVLGGVLGGHGALPLYGSLAPMVSVSTGDAWNGFLVDTGVGENASTSI